MTDAELVAACIARRPGAWEELIRRYAATALAAARQAILSALGRDDRALADDAVADAFAELVAHDFRMLRAFGPPYRLGGFLSLIARRRALNLARALSHAPRPLDWPAPGGGTALSETLSAEESPLERASAAELHAVVAAAMEELPARDRAVLARFYAAGESYAQIAQELDVSTQHVSVIMVRAKARLRRMLAERKIQ